MNCHRRNRKINGIFIPVIFFSKREHHFHFSIGWGLAGQDYFIIIDVKNSSRTAIILRLENHLQIWSGKQIPFRIRPENIKEVMKQAGIKDYEIREFIMTPMEKIIGFLASPAISGFLIMIIIGGIYFELRTPGVGFPSAAAILAAIIYFAPLYLEGLAQHWEIILFIVGLILIAVEIFAIPGFGVAGVSGILLVITGLTLSMVDNVVFKFNAVVLHSPRFNAKK